jgi:hypothetical protein
VVLLIEDGDFFRTYTLNYQGGARHPHLERIKGQPDYLDQIFAPLTGPVEKHPQKGHDKAGHQAAAR